MNVVHLNASDRQGGAALAVCRLHQAFRNRGVASRLLVEDKSSQDDSVEAIFPGSPDPTSSQRVQAIHRVYRDRNRTDVSNTHFSLSLLGYDLSGHPAVRAADLIHLHWIASLQTPASLRQLLNLNKPIFWTLHDLGPFTGGCHFPAACSQFQESCSHCPQLSSDPFGLPAAVLRDKKELWPAKALTLIAPSRWMADQATRSALFRSVPRLAVIPNGVDTAVFRPCPQVEARAALGLPLSGVYLLCGADQGQEKRKGFEPLGRILGDCIHDPRFRSAGGRILHLGELPAAWAGMDWPLISLGRLTEEGRMALAYAAADLFVLPSLEDNLPNMMLEALSCGTAVVAFNVGGVPEVVQDGWNGRVVPVGDEAALTQAILSLVADPERRAALGRNGRALIQERYSLSIQADGHLALYRSLLTDTTARANVSPDFSQQGSLAAPVPEYTDPGPAVGALLPDLMIHCLHEEWRTSETDRNARGQVIQELQTQLHRFETECAARLRVIEELETECAARLRVIEELETECAARLRVTQELETECAVRLRVIQELDAHQRRQKAEFVAQVQGYEQRLQPFQWLEGVVSFLRRLRAGRNSVGS